MKYYLAIDIGASSGRHILGHIDNGKLITEEIYRFQNIPKERLTEHGENETHLCWDTDNLYAEILNGLKVANDIGKIPHSVGIDTWGVDYVLLDENDKPIENVYCYRDARTENAMPKVHSIISQCDLYERTGIQSGSINTIYQLYCDKINGKMQKAKNFLLLPNYFNFLLTGIKRQEYTIATTTGMVNASTHCWDKEIIKRLGYEESLFGELSMPGSIVGEFCDAVADLVGYKATVTLPATHDTASAVLAAPLKKNAPYISSGTWSLLGVEEQTAHTNNTAMDAGYSNEGSTNATFRLQKNIMGLWMIQQVRHEAEDKYSFSELADMARNSPVDYIIDVNDNRFMAPKNMTQEISKAVGKELSLGETAYVIYNNLARSYAIAIKDLEKITGDKYATLNIIGGGSKNDFLNELTAKYTGLKIIAGPSECTAIGNILMQMIGCSDVENINAGREIVKNSFDIKEI